MIDVLQNQNWSHPDLHECYDTAGTHVAPINETAAMTWCINQSINQFTFPVFRTHEGSQQTITKRVLRMSRVWVKPIAPCVAGAQ